MKTISLDIKNSEDLEYLESVNYDPDILNTALTIGLKSIQMSQTTMNGNSYIEPLREIIVENNIENGENIKKIDNVIPEYNIKILTVCLNISELLNDKKLVSDFFKLSS